MIIHGFNLSLQSIFLSFTTHDFFSFMAILFGSLMLSLEPLTSLSFHSIKLYCHLIYHKKQLGLQLVISFQDAFCFTRLATRSDVIYGRLLNLSHVRHALRLYGNSLGWFSQGSLVRPFRSNARCSWHFNSSYVFRQAADLLLIRWSFDRCVDWVPFLLKQILLLDTWEWFRTHSTLIQVGISLESRSLFRIISVYSTVVGVLVVQILLAYSWYRSRSISKWIAYCGEVGLAGRRLVITDQSRGFNGLMSASFFFAFYVESLGRLFSLLRLVVVFTTPVVFKSG